MKWYSYLICLAITIIGIFSTMELSEILVVKSLDIGTPIVVEEENTKEIGKYDLSDLKFEPMENSTVYFTYSDFFEPISYDARFNDYKLIINGSEVPNINYLPGAINSLIEINYYNQRNELIASSQLVIEITFQATQTSVKLTTYNDSVNKIAYLQKYIDINGFVMQLFDLNVTGGLK